MTIIKNICVFCGSSPGAGDGYMNLAQEAGTVLAQSGFGIVYGGARIGLMGAVADGALAAGGKVTGVIPRFLQDKEVAHSGLSELHLTGTMHERQLMMAEKADAFVILPGGTGTMAEFFEILTWRQLGLHKKPIILINHVGYWGSLLSLLRHAEKEGFLRGGAQEAFTALDNIAALGDYLKEVVK